MQDAVKQIADWLGTGSLNIFGVPFSGKDTQGRAMAKLLHAQFLSSGHILRGSQKVASSIDKGNLAPTKDFYDIVLPQFSKAEYAGKPLILSSIGRWHGEEEMVMSALEQAKHTLKAVIFLDIPDSEIITRYNQSIKLNDRGDRKDDTQDVIQKRIDEFNQKTRPVVDFYKSKGLLITIDGTADRNRVTEDIINKLLALAKGS